MVSKTRSPKLGLADIVNKYPVALDPGLCDVGSDLYITTGHKQARSNQT